MLITTMARDAGLRYPLAPLLGVSGSPDLHVLARRLGLRHGTVRDAAGVGLTDRQADQWAVRLGLHPSWVWPEWWREAPDSAEIAALERRRSEAARRAALCRYRRVS